MDLAEEKLVAQRLLPLLAHQKLDLHLLLETQGALVIAGSMDAGPADHPPFELCVDRSAQRAKEGVLRLFHVAEELREMDNPRHVGLRKLHAADTAELERHN